MLKTLNLFLILSLIIVNNGLRIYSKSELSKYDGSKSDLPILLAIKGVVYDVTKGSGFYGKGGSYNALAGKDCARAIAKYSVEEINLTNDISDLPQNELDDLEKIIKNVYKRKYPIVGHMDYFKGDVEEL